MYYWEAALHRNGELIACWTSEAPGQTCAADQKWWHWPLMTRKGWRVRLRLRKNWQRHLRRKWLG